MQVPVSTLEGIEVADPAWVVWAKRSFLALVLVVVLAGLCGLLGARSATSSTRGGAWELALTHAATARAGLDVPWQVTARHAGGLPDQVTLAVTGSYFDVFETQGFTPEPAESSRDGETLFLTFDTPPSGDTLVVAYDAYIQPSSQVGAGGTVAVLDADDRPLASLAFNTALLP